MASTRGIEIQIGHILDDYSAEMKELTFRCAKKAALETKRMLRDTSPKSPGGGTYANSWSIKKGRNSYTVHNKIPSLTHLLENSHVIKNQYGTYGRTSPKHGQYIHIKPAEDFGNERFIDLVMEEAGTL